MATTKLIPLHIGKGGTIARALADRIGYAENPEKTDGYELVTGYACDPMTADAEFLLSKREYFALTGRDQGDKSVIAYQIRQSFKPGEITPEEANRLGYELAMRFTGGRHAFIVATHIDKHHFHNHVIFNSTALDCRRKFRNFFNSSYALGRLSDTICLQNGYSIIENPKPSRGHYGKWQVKQGIAKPPSLRDNLKPLLDKAISGAGTYDNFIEAMKAEGCEVKRGKHIAFRARGQKRFIRCSSLGAGYSEQEIKARLSNKTLPAPNKAADGKAPPEEKRQVNMLLDIQAALQAGKGPGYERWAKLFNLKEAAKTLVYLQEAGLTDYESLEVKTDEAVKRFGELTELNKTLESEITRNASLRKNIYDYIKTNTVYKEYRKSGYSAKYRAGHEGDIILHQSAKKAFNELGMEKLPPLSALNEEYARLSHDKKNTYREYVKARADMKRLLTAKANIDTLMNSPAMNRDNKHNDLEV